MVESAPGFAGGGGANRAVPGQARARRRAQPGPCRGGRRSRGPRIRDAQIPRPAAHVRLTGSAGWVACLSPPTQQDHGNFIPDGDGVDATRLEFRAVDRYGAPRPYATGLVTLEVQGPAVLVGNTPSDSPAAGGAGAVWIRSLPGSPGAVTVIASHPSLGSAAVSIQLNRARAHHPAAGVKGRTATLAQALARAGYRSATCLATTGTARRSRICKVAWYLVVVIRRSAAGSSPGPVRASSAMSRRP